MLAGLLLCSWKLYPVLCNLMDCSRPGFPVHHQLLELAQTHVHRVDDAIPIISASDIPFFSCLWSFPASWSFPMSQFFASGGQSIEVSASTSVLPMNTQGWFPLGWTGLIFAVQGTLKSFLQHHSSITSVLWFSAFFSHTRRKSKLISTFSSAVIRRWTTLCCL